MIYIKRFLWALGWVPVYILGSMLFLLGVFVFPPDKFLPPHLPTQLENVYKKLEPKP